MPKPIRYAPPGSGQGALIVLIVVVVISSLAYLGRDGLSRWFEFFRTKERKVLRVPYTLNVACLLLTNPDHYLEELRRINRTTDLTNKENRVAVALELRSLFVQRDLKEVATKSILDTKNRKQLLDAAQGQLMELRNQFEKELGDRVVETQPQAICCIVTIISANEKWSLQESRDPVSAFLDIKNMLNQPMNGGEFLDFVMFPRPQTFLPVAEGEDEFNKVVGRLMNVPRTTV